MPEYEDRGWLVAYPSEDLTNGAQLLPLLREFELVKRLGVYRELRAWVIDGARREERFAQAFGFRLDCGPATGFSPAGYDMNLWLWRHGQ